MSDIYSILAKNFTKRPNKTALIYKDKSYTYSELKEEISKVISFFLNKCHQQDVVSIYMENSDEWLISYFGILGAALICNPIGLRTSNENILNSLNFFKPKYLVTTDKLLDKVKRIGMTKEIKVITFKELINSSKNNFKRVTIDESFYSTLLFTSGTQGTQKAIRLRHKNVYSATRNIVEFLKIKEDSIYYQILPLSHSFGLGNVHATYWAGGKVIIADNTINYKKVLREIIKYNVIFFAAVPLTLKLIVENFWSDFLKTDKCLRTICTNTGPMPIEVTKKIINEFKNIQFYTYYGLTEASRSSFINFNQNPNKLSSVGRPTPRVEIKIMNKNKKFISEPEQLGKIAIRGDHVIEEYWKNQEATEKSFKDNWLLTDDIGYFDKDGFLYVVGREDDIINISGEKVSLQEIDNVICQLNFIKDVICLEESDELREFNINAYIVVDKDKLVGQQVKELDKVIIQHCRKYLDNYKIPQKIIFTNELPKTDSGKTQRRVFRQQIFN